MQTPNAPPPQPAAPTGFKPAPSPAVAALLSLLWPGLGHLYAGAVRGAVLFAVAASAGPSALMLLWALRPFAPGWVFVGMLFGLFGLRLLAAGAAVWVARGVERRADRWFQRPLGYALFFFAAFTGGQAAGNLVQGTAAVFYAASDASMEPTLEQGDWILVRRLGEDAKPRRDVVGLLVHDPGAAPLLRWIVGLEGDRLELRDGVVHRNGEALRGLEVAELEPTVVPEGHLFVLAQQGGEYVDSRTLGPVPASAFVGTVRAIYFAMVPGGPRLERIRMLP